MARAVIVSAVVAAVALAAPAFADDGGRPLSTTLSGAEECSNLGVCGVGDPDGTGTAALRINPGQGEVCFTITVANIGAAGTSVRRTSMRRLPAPTAPSSCRSPSGRAAARQRRPRRLPGADRELLLDILRNREQYYVNVHTPDFSAGAIRGELGD